MTGHIDLDALDALWKKATPGEWEARPGCKGERPNIAIKGSRKNWHEDHVISCDGYEGLSMPNGENDVPCVAVLHNAYPGLRKRLNDLEAFLLNAGTWLEHGDSGRLTRKNLLKLAKDLEPDL